MKDPRDIILAPVVSEKSYDLIDSTHTYTFEVDRRASKTEVKRAVESIFKVNVVAVNTMNRKGKRKRTGWTFGKRSDVKRALVTLAESDSIDIFGV
ncbi:MAG: 50S ribosomal protein L23 [Actinobacteria bacterium RBG_16_70_17]|nr:MAG: 50S ribosomal protein L23 [Actinobacteria bacterium RBG_16_70_17]